MLLPHLRSTLFPYTTLFRSGEFFQQIGNIGGIILIIAVYGDDDFTHRSGDSRQQSPVLPYVSLQVGKMKMRIAALDRKSTRLNSSHANISYAVFCLKKKN